MNNYMVTDLDKNVSTCKICGFSTSPGNADLHMHCAICNRELYIGRRHLVQIYNAPCDTRSYGYVCVRCYDAKYDNNR